MPFKKRNSVFLFAILTVFGLILALPGCKEGTEKSPVSSLLTGLDMANQAPALPEVTSSTKTFGMVGTVVSKASLETLANITVNLFYGGKLAMQTRTTSEGKFFFENLPSGLYDLVAAPNDPNYEEETYVVRVLEDGTLSPASPQIQIANKSTPATGILKVKVSGSILDKTTSKTIDNISVELYKDNVLLKTVYSSGEGKFFFEDLVVGQYRLEAGKESPIYLSQNANLTILSDGTVSPPTPTLYLSPRPFEDFTITGYVKTQKGESLSNIKVDLRKGTSSSDVLESTYTSGEGKFFFQNLTSGMFYLTAAAGTNTLQSSVYPVRILSSGEISPPSAEIFVPQNSSAQTVNVSGKVYDAFTGGPLEYVTVKLEGYSNNLTDKDGVFSFSELLPGVYKLTISKMGFETLNASFQVNGTTAPITTPSVLSYPLIHSERTGYGSIAGRFVNIATEEGIPEKLVTLWMWEYVTKKSDGTTESDWEITGRILTTRTLANSVTTPQDEAGTFKLTHLAPTTEGAYKYAFYIGDSVPSIVSVARPGSNFTWSEFAIAPGDLGLYDMTVESDKTTFWTNYEHEK